VKSEILNTNGCTVNFSAEVDKEQMSGYETGIIDELIKNANIKGFRPGKAPRAMIIKVYNDQIKNKVLSNNLHLILSEVFKEHNIFPIGEPLLKELNYEINKPLILKGEIEVYPEFEVANYSNMSLTRISSEVSDDDVDSYINNTAEYSAPFKTIEDRALETDDFAIIDFEIFHETTSVEKKDGSWVKISDENPDKMIQALSNAIKGMKIAEDKEIEMTLPENYAVSEISGKKVTVKIKIKEIRRKEIPVINDEFVKTLDPSIENLEQYKIKIKDFLISQKKSESKMNLKDQIAKNLIADNRFDLPPSLLKKQTEQMITYQKEQMKSQGADENIIKEMSEDIFKSASDTATQQLQLEFIYGKIIEKDKLEVTNENLEEALKKEAPKMGMNKDAFFKFLKNNKREAYFKQNLLIEKVYQFIIDQASIKDA